MTTESNTVEEEAIEEPPQHPFFLPNMDIEKLKESLIKQKQRKSAWSTNSHNIPCAPPRPPLDFVKSLTNQNKLEETQTTNETSKQRSGFPQSTYQFGQPFWMSRPNYLVDISPRDFVNSPTDHYKLERATKKPSPKQKIERKKLEEALAIDRTPHLTFMGTYDSIGPGKIYRSSTSPDFVNSPIQPIEEEENVRKVVRAKKNREKSKIL